MVNELILCREDPDISNAADIFFHTLHICRWNVNISDDGKDGFATLESAGFR